MLSIRILEGESWRRKGQLCQTGGGEIERGAEGVRLFRSGDVRGSFCFD